MAFFNFLNEQDVWRELIYNKYLDSKTMPQVKAKASDSPFWKGLVKNELFERVFFKTGDGDEYSFGEDTWLGDKPLDEQYPSIYNIVQRKQVSVAQMLCQIPLNITFTRGLNEYKWTR
jgi:hypothetical protein